VLEQLHKIPTGITGLDEVTCGGLPAGRPTLVCGGPGCGKTLLAMTFLVRGAIDHSEPGLLVSFDERITDLSANVASLGFDLSDLDSRHRLRQDRSSGTARDR
jgi:circadian clock protein KaiC